MTEQIVYVTQRELEKRWRLSGRTLERWRVEKREPPWYTFGGSIRYRLDEIEDFERRGRRGTPPRSFGAEDGGGTS